MYRSLGLLALLPSTFAHFILNSPPSLGFDDDKEGTAPCGGFDINFNNVSDVTAGAFSITSQTSHPQASWLFRVTTSTQEPFNWTNILPIVSQSGLGDFCISNLTVPDSFVGQQAIIQITQSAVDGDLYQVSSACAQQQVDGYTDS